jgi:hypothetical protein
MGALGGRMTADRHGEGLKLRELGLTVLSETEGSMTNQERDGSRPWQTNLLNLHG